MANFYARMKTNVADKLLKQSKQGVIMLTRTVVVPPANSWDDPNVTTESHPLDSIAKGVSEKYVDGVTILATDLEIVSAVPDGVTPTVSDIITIDGKNTAILRIVPIPAAGLTVAYKFLVRA